MNKFQTYSCCCCDVQDTAFIKSPHHSIKLIQIAFIIINLIATESGFLYLATIQVNWRRGGFPSFDLQRAVLGLSLVTTVVLLVLLRVRWRRWQSTPPSSKCPACGGIVAKNVGDLHVKAKCDWDFVDYVHSLLHAATFMVCAVCMMSYLPDAYEHPVEVAIKIVSFLLDLTLCLLFTKSCMSAYFQYQEFESCRCSLSAASLPPPPGEHFSDEEEPILSKIPSATRQSNGHVYTMVGTEA